MSISVLSIKIDMVIMEIEIDRKTLLLLPTKLCMQDTALTNQDVANKFMLLAPAIYIMIPPSLECL